MSLIDTSMGRLAVERTGHGEPCVLWHSLFVDSTTWQRMRDELAELRSLIIIDGPGAGGSDPLDARATIAECAEGAVEVLDALGIDGPVDWVGNAWGGHVGIALAAAHPDRVRSLVAIGSPVHRLGARGGTERVKMQSLVPGYRILGPVRPLINALLQALLSDNTRAHDPEASAIVRAAFLRPTRRSMALQAQSFGLHRPDLTEEALGIGIPVLFAATTDRGEWTPDEARAVADRMPNARVQAVPGRGLPPLESPRETLDAITTFWADP